MSKLQTFYCVLADGKTRWTMGHPVPLQNYANIKLERLIVLNGNIEAFGRPPNNPTEGLHWTLLKPTVNLVCSVGPMAALNDVLKTMMSGEKVQSIALLDGKIWELNKPVPGDNGTTIVGMFLDGDSGMADVVVVPNPGTEAELNQIFFVFTLMPLTIMMCTAKADLNEWIAIMNECEEAATSFDDDEGDEDEEDDEEEEIEEPATQVPQSLIPNVSPFPQAPPPPQAATVPNGTGATTQQQQQQEEE